MSRKPKPEKKSAKKKDFRKSKIASIITTTRRIKVMENRIFKRPIKLRKKT
jgi:hypothetical protein